MNSAVGGPAGAALATVPPLLELREERRSPFPGLAAPFAASGRMVAEGRTRPCCGLGSSFCGFPPPWAGNARNGVSWTARRVSPTRLIALQVMLGAGEAGGLTFSDPFPPLCFGVLHLKHRFVDAKQLVKQLEQIHSLSRLDSFPIPFPLSFSCFSCPFTLAFSRR